MFYYNMKSRKNIVHRASCRCMARRAIHTIGRFASAEEAFSHGYRICRHCNPLANLYRAEEQTLLTICRENGLMLQCFDDCVDVTSAFGQWRLVVEADGKRVSVYHKNAVGKAKGRGCLAGYHKQDVSCDTLTECVAYVAEHDSYCVVIPFPVEERTKVATVRTAEKRGADGNVVALINAVTMA